MQKEVDGGGVVVLLRTMPSSAALPHTHTHTHTHPIRQAPISPAEDLHPTGYIDNGRREFDVHRGPQ